MGPSHAHEVAESNPPGPHPSYIQIAKPYVFQQTVQECITVTGTTEAKDDSIRLQGVAWIDSVRKALHLYNAFGGRSSVYLQADLSADLFEHTIQPWCII